MVSRGVSVSLSSSAPAALALARAFFFLPPGPFFSVAEVGVGWLDPPPPISFVLANEVESGVGAPGVDVEDAASELSGCCYGTYMVSMGAVLRRAGRGVGR